MRVLVTGASGRIGTAVVEKLPESVEVWTTSRTDPDGATNVKADLTDAGQAAALVDAAKPDVVIHLAGAVGSDHKTLFEGNVLATTNLMQAVDQGTHVVVAGSAAEYGSHDVERVDENEPLRPISAYGWSKTAQTRLACGIGTRRDVRVTVARPFNVVSADMPVTTPIGNIADQIKAHGGATRMTLVAGRLDVTRDFVPLSFVADSFIAIALEPNTEPVYNICSGLGLQLSDVVDAMAGLRGVELDVTLDPELAAIPAVDGIVGDPSRLTLLTGMPWTPSVDVLARVALAYGTPGPDVPSDPDSPTASDSHE